VETPQFEGQTPIAEDMPEPKEKLVLVPSLPLPPSGGPGAPWFDGYNISMFLERYKDLCDDYKVSPDMRRERIVHFCCLPGKNTFKKTPVSVQPFNLDLNESFSDITAWIGKVHYATIQRLDQVDA
jgi:hypothetical protein